MVFPCAPAEPVIAHEALLGPSSLLAAVGPATIADTLGIALALDEALAADDLTA